MSEKVAALIELYEKRVINGRINLTARFLQFIQMLIRSNGIIQSLQGIRSPLGSQIHEACTDAMEVLRISPRGRELLWEIINHEGE